MPLRCNFASFELTGDNGCRVKAHLTNDGVPGVSFLGTVDGVIVFSGAAADDETAVTVNIKGEDTGRLFNLSDGDCYRRVSDLVRNAASGDFDLLDRAMRGILTALYHRTGWIVDATAA